MKDYETTVDVRQGQVTPIRVRLRRSVGRGGAWVTASLAVLLVGGGAVMGVLSNNLADELAAERDEGRLASDDPRFTAWPSGRTPHSRWARSSAVSPSSTSCATHCRIRRARPSSRATGPWLLSPDGAGGSLRVSF